MLWNRVEIRLLYAWIACKHGYVGFGGKKDLWKLWASEVLFVLLFNLLECNRFLDAECLVQSLTRVAPEYL